MNSFLALLIFSLIVYVLVYQNYQQEGFAMSFLYTDPSGNLSSSTDITTDSINVAGYGSLKAKMELLDSTLTPIINQAEIDLNAKADSARDHSTSGFTAKVKKQNDDFNAKIKGYDDDIKDLKTQFQTSTGTTIKKTVEDLDTNVLRRDKKYKLETMKDKCHYDRATKLGCESAVKKYLTSSTVNDFLTYEDGGSYFTFIKDYTDSTQTLEI